MKKLYENLKADLVSERVVEVDFIIEMFDKYFEPGNVVLDIGGIPSRQYENQPIIDTIKKSGAQYYVADHRGGDFQGDFVNYNFEDKKFDIGIFLSSLEHFPQCTEGDMVVREKEDVKGFHKALSLLNDGGIVFLTIPYGVDQWYNYHQSYDHNTILELTEGSDIIEECIYVLNSDNKWESKTAEEVKEIEINNKRVVCVGCFICKKNETRYCSNRFGSNRN